jgi:hypothetical protein
MGNLILSYYLAAWVFVPVFIIALVILRSALRALVLALTFTVGAAAGYLAALAAGRGLMRSSLGAPPADTTMLIFCTAAAIGGGLLAVFILGRFSKTSPWRRS